MIYNGILWFCCLYISNSWWKFTSVNWGPSIAICISLPRLMSLILDPRQFLIKWVWFQQNWVWSIKRKNPVWNPDFLSWGCTGTTCRRTWCLFRLQVTLCPMQQLCSCHVLHRHKRQWIQPLVNGIINTLSLWVWEVCNEPPFTLMLLGECPKPIYLEPLEHTGHERPKHVAFWHLLLDISLDHFWILCWWLHISRHCHYLCWPIYSNREPVLYAMDDEVDDILFWMWF